LGCAHGVVFFGTFHANSYAKSGGVSLLTRIREILYAATKLRMS